MSDSEIEKRSWTDLLLSCDSRDQILLVMSKTATV